MYSLKFATKQYVISALTVLLILGLSPGISRSAVTWSNDGTTSGWSYHWGAGTYGQVSSPVNTGSTALRFQINSNQQDSEGRYHNEYLQNDIAQVNGSDIWYGWATYIPSVNETPDVHRVAFAQFFDKRVNNKPLNIFMLESNGRVSTNIYSNRNNYNEFTKYEIGEYKRGAWNYFVVNVKFSNGSSAYTRIWQDGVLVLDSDIPNAFSNSTHIQLHMGAYVHAGWSLSTSPIETRIIYHDSMKVGTSFAEVNPAPTNQTIYHPVADTYVSGGSTGSNYGTSSTLAIKNAVGTAYDRMSFLKFDLTPADGSITSAKLRIYCTSLSGSFTLTPYQVSDNWAESTITYYNMPSLGSSMTAKTISSAGEYYEFDITSYVNSQLSGDNVVSIALFDGGQGNQLAMFDSRQGTNMPQIILN